MLRANFFFWKAIGPPLIAVRDMLIRVHLFWHQGRQEYLLGKLAAGKSLDDFLAYLAAQGFGNNFIAHRDEGQVLSLRRLEDFEWQYHLRIFKDGEVRGHYEYTPEAHPIKHFREIRMEARREDFLHFLGDWVS